MHRLLASERCYLFVLAPWAAKPPLHPSDPPVNPPLPGPRRLWLVRLPALALCVLFGSSARADGSMTFATPDGWLDVSPGAPPENLAAVPEAVRVGATSDLLHAHYAVARNLEASMVVVYMPDDESGAIDEAYLDHFVSTRMFEKRMRLGARHLEEGSRLDRGALVGSSGGHDRRQLPVPRVRRAGSSAERVDPIHRGPRGVRSPGRHLRRDRPRDAGRAGPGGAEEE